MTEESAPAFNPKIVLGLVLFGALAFIATLYFISTGQTGENNGSGGHAAGNGLNGYAALAQLLESDGYNVAGSRRLDALDDRSLLVLTPPHSMDARELQSVVEKRRRRGPTIIILPKWITSTIPEEWDVEIDDGWVVLNKSAAPRWLGGLNGNLEMQASIKRLRNKGAGWSGMGLSGDFPEPGRVMSIKAEKFTPVILDSHGGMSVGYLDDDNNDGRKRWATVIVAEPDLFNNYGMAEAQRANLAREIFAAMLDDRSDMPIVFDLTQNGLIRSKNLLTLAFQPPFLAATICLIIAIFLIGWRAFRRFGPPVAQARTIAFGKRQLVANSAALIQRTKRLHLLSDRYGDMMRGRIAALLGLHRLDDHSIDAAISRRLADEPPFSQQLSQLRAARSAPEILRAANALSSLERKLSR